PADPPDQFGHRPQFGGPGTGVGAVRHDRPVVRRTGRDHRRRRVLHRVLPVVRLRPAGLFRPVPGEAPAAAVDPRGESADLVRPVAPGSARGRYSPRAYAGTIPIWVGVGGSPASAINTGHLGLPMALALLLGPINLHERTVELYRYGAESAGHDPDALPISINSHGYVGRTSQQAREVMYPYFAS